MKIWFLKWVIKSSQIICYKCQSSVKQKSRKRFYCKLLFHGLDLSIWNYCTETGTTKAFHKTVFKNMTLATSKNVLSKSEETKLGGKQFKTWIVDCWETFEDGWDNLLLDRDVRTRWTRSRRTESRSRSWWKRRATCWSGDKSTSQRSEPKSRQMASWKEYNLMNWCNFFVTK